MLVNSRKKMNKKSFLCNFNNRGYLLKIKLIFLIIVSVLVYLYLYSHQTKFNTIDKILSVAPDYDKLMKDYIIWNDKCRMRKFDIYDADVIKHFDPQKYESCSTEEPLTIVRFNSTSKLYTLYVDENEIINNTVELDCCYQTILRDEEDEKPDKKVKFTKCLNFNQSVQIPTTSDNILVKCQRNINETSSSETSNNQIQNYINGHPMMQERKHIRERIEYWKKKNNQRAPSILMIGIDSISRNNLFRSMSQTAELLQKNDWFEMSGYNKIASKTFRNLMAVLTGYNSTTSLNLDDCPIIWKLFQKYGYVTAYAEDEASMGTSNFNKRAGFKVPPVDYYLKPFVIAAEQNLRTYKKPSLKYCLGYKHSAEYIFDYAIQLATRYKYDPFFGLFWVNSFSHVNMNDCSSMDLKIAEYIGKLYTFDSVVIFFSDRGIPWGPAANTKSGYLEERLPFMFIWLPPWLKTKYPEFVNGLTVNKDRLTNPYDIHMTLKHLLEVSGRTTMNLTKSVDCPNCQTLLKPVPYSRSCKDIAIPDEWCACFSYQSIDKKSNVVCELAQSIIDDINNYIENFNNVSNSNICEKLQLNNIVEAYGPNITETYSTILFDEEYRLIIKTIPGNALYESTIFRKSFTDKVEIRSQHRRLNSHSSDSECVSDIQAKMYCQCTKVSFFRNLIYSIYKSLLLSNYTKNNITDIIKNNITDIIKNNNTNI